MYGIRSFIMETKLTVRVSRHILDKAKRYARENNTTLTQLISAYLQQIPEPGSELANAPIVRRLSGSIAPDVSVEDYKKHLDEKYGSG
jgi:hypothetical protein